MVVEKVVEKKRGSLEIPNNFKAPDWLREKDLNQRPPGYER